MTETMFSLPGMENVKKCVITEESVNGKEEPELICE